MGNQWFNSLSYKLGLLNYRNSACFIAISRDHSCEENKVTIDKEGQPVIQYKLTKQDESNLMHGWVIKLVLYFFLCNLYFLLQITQQKLMRSSGAKVIQPGTEFPKWFVSSCESESIDQVCM